MKHYKENTVLVGLFASIILFILSFLLIWQSNLFIRVSGYELVGRFDSVGGLLTQSEVRFRGYRVGRVVDIQPKKDAILVRFSVTHDVQIPNGSSLRVIFDGLVGEKYVEVLQQIIKQNTLKDFDDAKLLPSSIELESLI